MMCQLVLQWNGDSLADYDRLIRVENTLIQELDSEHDVDGHDQGSGQMNIFIRTTTPEKAFEQIKSILANDNVWKDVRVAYRDISKSNYIVLWPHDVIEFKVV